MATQTYGGLTNAQRTFYEMVLLERLLPNLIMFGEGQKGSIPKNTGLQSQWRIWNSLPLATTPLVEGTPPSDTSLSISTVTATVAQYGAWVKLSDLLAHSGIDAAWTETSQLLGEQAGQTLHTVLVNVLAAGTNVRYAGGQSGRTAITAANKYSGDEARRARRILARAKVQRYRDRFYHAMCHPDASQDIQADSDFKTPAQYGAGVAKNGGPDLIEGEIGSFAGIRYMESTDAPIFAGGGSGGLDVYGTLHWGPNWFGIRDLVGQHTPNVDAKSNLGVQVSGVPVETQSKDDPLRQYGVLGWKTSFVTKILQEARGLRTEHYVTA